MSPSLNTTLGAVFIGCVVSATFYGITSLQTFFYFTNYNSDRMLYRLSVFILWIFDTVHMVFIVYLVYHTLITDAVRLFIPEWSSAALIIVTNITNCMIRMIFLYRIWYLNRKTWVIVVPIGLVAFTAVAVGTLYGVKMSSLSFSSINKISWELYAALSGDVLADLSITITLSVMFWRMRSGIKRTDTLLNILILYTVNTGLLTSMIAVGTLVTYSVMSDNYIFMGIFFVLAKASFNSLLATLNARSHLREYPKEPTLHVPPRSRSIPLFYPVPQDCWSSSDTVATPQSVYYAV